MHLELQNGLMLTVIHEDSLDLRFYLQVDILSSVQKTKFN